MIGKTFLAALIFLAGTQWLEAQAHWESVVLASDNFNYFEAVTTPPPSDWNTRDFDDSGWKSGAGGIGYEDGDDVTIISKVNSLYLRINFTVSDLAVVEKAALSIDYDDAFVAYLNGAEIARSANITDEQPTFDSHLTTDREARVYQGGLPESYLFSSDDLEEGVNTLAIQICNNGISSSDLSAIPYLFLKLNSDGLSYREIPAWFEEPVILDFSVSDIPIVLINTYGQTLVTDPKITGHLSIVANTDEMNSISGPYNVYDGPAGIDLRGASSVIFYPKKSMNIELRDEFGVDTNYVLLGMPSENDWVLYAPYADGTLMRNALIYELGRETGRWSPRTRFCELFIDDEYRGVYVLMEKIKRDKERVDIATLNPWENSGDDLTGGYIIQIDRPDGTEGVDYWVSSYRHLHGTEKVYFNYVYPKPDDISSEQKKYIQNIVSEFERTLYSETFEDIPGGYRTQIDETSFIDFCLINEFSKNVDAYRLSTYFYKDKDSNGGKINMGPLWDFNLSLGEVDYNTAGDPEGWMTFDSYDAPFWFFKLREDPMFNSNLRRRYEELREDVLSQENINHLIDSFALVLENARLKNFSIWPVTGTYQSEIEYMKAFIDARLEWMDSQIALIELLEMPDDTTLAVLPSIANAYEIYAYPNPVIHDVNIVLRLAEHAATDILIFNELGQKVYQSSMLLDAGYNEIPVSMESYGAGMYVYQVYVNSRRIRAGKIIKR